MAGPRTDFSDSPGMAPPLGDKHRVGSAIKRVEGPPRGQRVLDGSAGVGASSCSEFAVKPNKASGEMSFPERMKTCPLSMQPPRLAAIAHGKLSSHVCPKSAPSERKSVQPQGQFVQPVQTTTTRSGSAFAALAGAVSLLMRPSRSRLLLEPARHENLAQRNFDTALPLPVLLRAGIRQSLGKRRQRAHRRRFARPPRF